MKKKTRPFTNWVVMFPQLTGYSVRTFCVQMTKDSHDSMEWYTKILNKQLEELTNLHQTPIEGLEHIKHVNIFDIPVFFMHRYPS